MKRGGTQEFRHFSPKVAPENVPRAGLGPELKATLQLLRASGDVVWWSFPDPELCERFYVFVRESQQGVYSMCQ